MQALLRYWRDGLLGGGYLLLLVVGLQIGRADAWAGLLGAVLGLSLLAWRYSLIRLRAVADTPTSRIASAAQGYVELVGNGRALPDAPIYSPAHRLPCLWYRYRAFTRQGDSWRQTEADESDALFILDDGSGRCLLDPMGAEIATQHKETHIRGDDKIEEELLLAGDRIYVLGEFGTRGGGHARFDERVELGQMLADWKDDPAELRRRFDLDGNGQIDAQEWQLARQAAEREVAMRKREALNQPVDHIVSRPDHGRPYLITNFPPERLTARFRVLVWLHGAVTFASLLGLAWALHRI